MPEKKAQKNLAGLVRLLTLLAFLSGVAIVATAIFGIHGIYARYVISMAEKEAVLISHLLVNQQRNILFSRNNSSELHLELEASFEPLFDLRLREFLHPFDIVKVKIFTLDTKVIYSTDDAIIGESDPDNSRLLRALRGEVDSHLENKDSLRDLKDETTFDVDVVETYTPIIVEGRILGVFELYRDVTKFRSDIRSGTLKSLILLSTILVIVYFIAFYIARIGMKQLAAAEKKLRKQAMTDALTNIYNRGELMLRAEEEAARVIRHELGSPHSGLSLILLDIDHFKRVNDDYGHLAGDAILQQLSERLKQGLRIYDILGRYGGEEFLLLLPDTDLASARAVAERIRVSIAEDPFYYNHASIALTVSLGVSILTPEISLTEAINRADQSMYSAKLNGRNRVESQEF